jgi:C2 domain
MSSKVSEPVSSGGPVDNAEQSRRTNRCIRGMFVDWRPKDGGTGYNGALMRWLVASCMVFPGCIILSGSGDGDGGAAPTEPGPTDPFACPAWEGASEVEVQALMQGAIDELKSEGQDISTEIWNDPTRFSAVVDRVYDHAGCPFPDGAVQQGLHASGGPNYFCGPGHGSGALQHPPVSKCINLTCRDHDGCYAMCSQEPGLICSWSGATQPCDDTFLARIAECPTEKFVDVVVKTLPYVLDFLPLPCAGIECPAGDELGLGVCSVDAASGDCQACLQHFDPESTCRERTDCEGEPLFEHCYAGSCPQMFACYGENPSSELWKSTCASAGYTGVPDDYSWELEVISGLMPLTKPGGTDWDVNVAFGFAPPDPFVLVELIETGQVSETTSPEDTAQPQWNHVVFMDVPAPMIETGFNLAVYDEDLIDHDLIGTCTFTPTPDTFCDGLLKADCAPEDLIIWLRLQPQL